MTELINRWVALCIVRTFFVGYGVNRRRWNPLVSFRQNNPFLMASRTTVFIAAVYERRYSGCSISSDGDVYGCLVSILRPLLRLRQLPRLQVCLCELESNGVECSTPIP